MGELTYWVHNASGDSGDTVGEVASSIDGKGLKVR